MRKIILTVAVSLDGFIEGPNGEYDWCLTDQDYGMTDFLNQTDAIFFGRKSYELYRNVSPDLWQDKKQYVFSTTLKQVPGKASLINSNVENKVKEIKSGTGKDIWLFGGAGLTTSFINLKLIDELLLAIHPLILGDGKALFPKVDKRIKLKLLHSTSYLTGLVQNHYKVLY